MTEQISTVEATGLAAWFDRDLPCEHSLHGERSNHGGPAEYRFQATMPCCGLGPLILVCGKWARSILRFGHVRTWRCHRCDTRRIPGSQVKIRLEEL
jgi:hypothetical protein